MYEPDQPVSHALWALFSLAAVADQRANFVLSVGAAAMSTVQTTDG